MKYVVLRYETTDSTNRLLREYKPKDGEEAVVAVAGYQTAGRGQGSNTWESEPGKNLLFSMLIHPRHVDARRQFVLSMASALAQKDALETYAGNITLKWPNDVYWKDRKIGGTLIETRLTGHTVNDCIIGTGINVNQRLFRSNAPNPVSLYNITGQETDITGLLDRILAAFAGYYAMTMRNDFETIRQRYHEALYRRQGTYRYMDSGGVFEAEIAEVRDDGRLVLRRKDGRTGTYAFKEVKFVIQQQIDT